MKHIELHFALECARMRVKPFVNARLLCRHVKDRKVLKRFDMPGTCVSDNNPQFKNTVLEELV